jgi:hypothetical protein
MIRKGKTTLAQICDLLKFLQKMTFPKGPLKKTQENPLFVRNFAQGIRPQGPGQGKFRKKKL